MDRILRSAFFGVGIFLTATWLIVVVRGYSPTAERAAGPKAFNAPLSDRLVFDDTRRPGRFVRPAVPSLKAFIQWQKMRLAKARHETRLDQIVPTVLL